MYSRFIAILVALATLGLTACNTMQGLGQDIERGGEKLVATMLGSIMTVLDREGVVA